MPDHENDVPDEPPDLMELRRMVMEGIQEHLADWQARGLVDEQ